MEGYTAITYLSSDLTIKELDDAGYYEASDGFDTVCISRAALKELADFYQKVKLEHDSNA